MPFNFYSLLAKPACQDPLAATHFRVVAHLYSESFNNTEELIVGYLTTGQVAAFVNGRERENLTQFGARAVHSDLAGSLSPGEYVRRVVIYAPGQEGETDRRARHYFRSKTRFVKETRTVKIHKGMRALLFRLFPGSPLPLR